MSRRRRLLIWLATGGERGGDGLALGKGSGPRPARGTSRGSLGQTKESFFLLGICRRGGRYCMGTPNDLTTLQHKQRRGSPRRRRRPCRRSRAAETLAAALANVAARLAALFFFSENDCAGYLALSHCVET